MGDKRGPFDPPWEDQAMELKTSNGCHCVLFDTLCKAAAAGGEKRVRDREIQNIYLAACRGERQRQAEGEGGAPNNI